MKPETSQRIIGGLIKHFAETEPQGLSVGLAVDAIGLTPSHVHKACRHAGVRAKELLDAELRKRLEERLHTHDAQQLAYQLGYTSVAGFRMAVRRLYGKKLEQLKVDMAETAL